MQKPLTLSDCIRIALTRNIALRISQGDYNRAKALHAGSYGRFLPVLSVEGFKTNEAVEADTSSSDTLQPVVRFTETNFGNQARIFGRAQLYMPSGATIQFTTDLFRDAQFPLNVSRTKKNNRTYSVSLTQPLLRGAGPTVARSSFLGTGYDQQIEEKSLFNRKLETVFAVKRAYYVALQQRELIKVNQSALLRDSTLVEASKALIVARQATRRDVLSAEIRFAEDKAAFLASQSDFEFALDNLKEVMGLPIDMPVALDSMGLSYTPVTLDEPDLVRQALANNPLIHSAEIAISQNRLQRRVAKNTLLPQLDLVAAYSSKLETDLLTNRDLSRTGGWEARLNLSYPFLNREAGAKAEAAEIAVLQQQDRLLSLQRETMIEVRDIVRGVYSAAAQLDAIKRGIDVAQEKLDFANTMFNLGRASNFDITDAQESLLKAQNQYLRKLVDYHTQLALLESLIGRPIKP